MSKKTFRTRIQHKHDIEANWLKAENFVPLQGELIVYDADENYDYQRIKIGDGVKTVTELPFTVKQNDWNQNDETAIDFIKNRTHYEYEGFIPVFSLTATKTSDTTLSLIVNWQDLWDKFYIWTGYVQYADLIIEANVSCSDYNGYASLEIDGVTTSFPPYSTQEVVLTGSGFTEDSYPVEFSNKGILIKKLDEKFLPDIIIETDINAREALTKAEIAQATADNKISYQDYILKTPPVDTFTLRIVGKDKIILIEHKSDIVYCSKDEIKWSEITLPLSQAWSDGIYSNNKFVVIAQDTDKAIYSEDGINWIEVILPQIANWNSIIYGNNKFIITADTDKAIYSEDGINWIEMTMPYSSTYLLAYGGDKFVAIPKKYNEDNGKGIILYSENGINWKETALPSSYTLYPGLHYLTYGKDKFIGLLTTVKNGSPFEDTGSMFYSYNGIDWIVNDSTGRNFIASGSWDFVYANNIFVAASSPWTTEDTIINYSFDGIIWTKKQTSYRGKGLIYNNNTNHFILFYGKSYQNYVLAYSEDGIDWVDTTKALVQNNEYITSQVKQLLEVPETYVKSVNGMTGDVNIEINSRRASWDINDPDNPGFIEGRTHYVGQLERSTSQNVTEDQEVVFANFAFDEDAVYTFTIGNRTESRTISGKFRYVNNQTQGFDGYLIQGTGWTTEYGAIPDHHFDIYTEDDFKTVQLYCDITYPATLTMSWSEEVVKQLDEKYIPDTIARIDDIPDAIINPATASIGQTIIVKAIDENGKPTEWEAADFPKDNGLTIAQISALDALFRKCNYTSDATAEYEAFKLAFGLTEGEIDQNKITVTYEESSEKLTVTSSEIVYDEPNESMTLPEEYVSYNTITEEITIGGN